MATLKAYLVARGKPVAGAVGCWTCKQPHVAEINAFIHEGYGLPDIARGLREVYNYGEDLSTIVHRLSNHRRAEHHVTRVAQPANAQRSRQRAGGATASRARAKE